jgi:spore coat protein CotH
MPKKPYKLKLYDKAKLLGMHSDKNWILLANYDDKSLLRNYVAYALGDRIGMAWSPHSGYVEVELNGQYQGIYELIESIRVDSNRVDIEEMDADDIAEPEVTGGYLFELDQRRDCATNVLFTTGRNVPYCIDTPDEDDIVSQQYDYLKGYMAGVESALYNASFADPTTGYAAYIDTASFIDWYLVNELFKNQDAASFSSIWQYKDRNGKLFRGPLWDFDISAGNVNYGSDADPRGFWIRGGTYYSRLFQDPAFAQATRQRWDALKTSQVDTLPALIDQMAGSLDAAAPANFQAWPILDQYTWPNAVITGSYDGDVDYFKDWLIQRTEWLDANL